jgi:hypothetical protein
MEMKMKTAIYEIMNFIAAGATVAVVFVICSILAN